MTRHCRDRSWHCRIGREVGLAPFDRMSHWESIEFALDRSFWRGARIDFRVRRFFNSAVPASKMQSRIAGGVARCAERIVAHAVSGNSGRPKTGDTYGRTTVCRFGGKRFWTTTLYVR